MKNLFLIITLIFLFKVTSTAQEQYSFMLVTYYPSMNTLYIASDRDEAIEEEVKVSKKERLSGAPLLKKVKSLQEGGWQVINFNNASSTMGGEFYCYLRKKI